MNATPTDRTAIDMEAWRDNDRSVLKLAEALAIFEQVQLLNGIERD